MKSVAWVTTTFPTMATFTENDVRGLIERGVRVRVLTLGRRGTRFQPEHAGLLDRVAEVGSPVAPASWAALLGWFVRRPHVLVPEVLRMLWASRGSLYALAGHVGYLPAAARVAAIVERERIERVHGGWAHFPASVALLAARLTGARFSMSAHAGADLYRTQAYLAEKVRAADFVSACVRTNADMIERLAGAQARVHRIYHGVDLGRFDAAARAPDPEPLLLTVGRLAPAKGFDLAVRVVALLRGRAGGAPRLVMVGEGPERERLEALARELGVAERVRFAGTLDHDALLPLYRRCWLLLAPSRVLANGRRDGIPNVVVEAMAMGVPVVGTAATGIEEIVETGVTGWVVPPDDADALAAAVAQALDRPEALRALGGAARRRVAESFDQRANFERLYALMNGAAA
jgi:glycosyltransferase involved in cell wall biosynthesis